MGYSLLVDLTLYEGTATVHAYFPAGTWCGFQTGKATDVGGNGTWDYVHVNALHCLPQSVPLDVITSWVKR